MSEKDDGEVDQRKIRLEVKKTRRGKLLTFADDDAKGGFRGMTDAERKAHHYIENIVRKFDTENVDPGRVGTVNVSKDGGLSVKWCCKDARFAAGSAE